MAPTVADSLQLCELSEATSTLQKLILACLTDYKQAWGNKALQYHTLQNQWLNKNKKP